MSALTEILDALPAAATARDDENGQNRLGPADKYRDGERDILRKLGGDLSQSAETPPEADEKAALAALLETITAVQRANAAYEHAVDLKEASMLGHGDELHSRTAQKRLELEAAKPPVKKGKTLVGGSLLPDPKFSLGNYSGDLKKCLEALQTLVSNNAAQSWPNIRDVHNGNVGNFQNAVTAAVKGMVGRGVATYLFKLDLAAMAFGTDWHLTETIRLFDQLRKNMLYVTESHGGVKVAYWRMRNKFNEKYNSKPGEVNDDNNDKEDGLGFSALGSMVHRLWSVRSAYPEYAERVEWGLTALLAFERKWYCRTGGAWNFPRDRVQHPFAAGTGYYAEQLELATKDPALYERIAKALLAKASGKGSDWLQRSAKDRAAFCRRQIETSVTWQEAEMGPVSETIDGKKVERLTWAYNVWEATEPKNRNDRREDGYQPTCYIWHMQMLLMKLGLFDLGMFGSQDFQEKLANTQYALTQPAPLKYRRVGENEWTDTLCWINVAPIAERFVDSKNEKGKRNRYTFENEQQKRTLVTGAIDRNNDGYFEEARWGDDAGLALLFGSDELVEYSHKMWGTPDKPHSKGSGWFVGMALRLAAQQGLVRWR